jgi:hypothetical protein
MPQVPKPLTRPDLLKHFQRHCAAVKLAALVLLVVRDIGIAVAVGGGCVGGVALVVKHFA